MTLVRQSPAPTGLSWGAEEATALRRGVAALGLDATPGQFARLETYAGLLLKWNRTYNLLGATTARDLIDSHLLDSLATLPALSRWLPKPTATTRPVLFDIGSGAGLPGLALAIMLPGQSIALVEPIGKKNAFLRQAIAHCRLQNVQVVEGRIEDLDPAAMAPGDRQAVAGAATDASVLPSFICRAFTSLERFAALCRPHARETSLLFAMKAARVAEEVAELTAGEVLAVEPLPIIAPGVQRNLVVMRPGRLGACAAANPA
jgi:16S rRNA (guanine527-N7)-methyltransferase